jgi:[ribosomal protein S18]-alanine N-acetyltransferase
MAIYTLRYMQMLDVPHVVAIDALAFHTPWPARSYAFEIQDSNNSHMITLCQGDMIIGYAGMWLIEDEAHISTIATHPDYRGFGFGELLLIGLLNISFVHKAAYAVLEVRVGNTPAIALYQKYEFAVVGTRKNYYRDTNEDAHLMHLAPLNPEYQGRVVEKITRLKEKISFENLLLAGKPNNN